MSIARTQRVPDASRVFLGLDVGRSGAAALTGSQGGLIALVAWSRLGRSAPFRTRVVSWYHPEWGIPGRAVIIPERAGAIGTIVALRLGAIGLMENALIACEDAYLGKNVATMINLSRFSGGIVAPLEEIAGKQAVWVKAVTWRSLLLGLRANASREEAKAASLALIPKRVACLDEALEATGREDHSTDAAGVAEWLRLSRGRSGR